MLRGSLWDNEKCRRCELDRCLQSGPDSGPKVRLLPLIGRSVFLHHPAILRLGWGWAGAGASGVLLHNTLGKGCARCTRKGEGMQYIYIYEMATTLVGVQRDIRSLKSEVATLGVAVDDHTHRLDRIEQRLGIGVTQN